MLDVLLCVRKPDVFKIDDNGDLHAEGGPALSWTNNLSYFFWHGRRTAADAVTLPATINNLVRLGVEDASIMGERLDWEEATRQSGPTIIDIDPEFGYLYEISLPQIGRRRIVEVINGTKDKNGRDKKYYLRVPFEDARGNPIETARAAVAWTYGMRVEEYSPRVRT
jgi:hypothetical protein